MDSQRNILLIALLFVSFLIYQQWNADHHPKPQSSGVAQQVTTNGEVPSHTNTDSLIPNQAINPNDVITIKTDVLELKINTLGGDIINAQLLTYNDKLDSKLPYTLLSNDPSNLYTAQSGLIGPNGIDSAADRAQFITTAKDFTLASGQKTLRVPLTYQKDGITYTKTFIFHPNSYAVDVEYTVDNKSATPAHVQMYAQIQHKLVDKSGSLTMPTYAGPAYSTKAKPYEKFSFKDMQKENLNISFHQGWVAMLQHYFVSAWIPQTESGNVMYSNTNNGVGNIGVRMPMTTVAANSTQNISATLWVGPKLQNQMEAVAPNLQLTVDYGWLWFIAKPLHSLLAFIHSVVGNWGVAIIILTFIVRGAMYPLTKAQYTSMAKMRMLQPKMQAMRERFKDDRQRLSQETMQLYKTEKVNPLGGCLPLVVQMPIFIALYWALMGSVELRHAPFFGWIHDLSAPDPYYILPLLMGVTMFFIQKMSPTTVADPMQQKIMTFMPVIFTVFFLWFPSGLVLYWLTSNIVTLIQQNLIYRGLEKKGLHSKKSKK